MDLHPVPVLSYVSGISDVSTNGKVYVAGHADSRPVAWEVDVETHAVIERVLSGGNGDAFAVNAAGEVVVSGPAVRTLATGLLEPLPGLSSKRSCSSSGRGINNDGTVVGWSGVQAKGQCVKHAVVWTRIN